MSKKNQAAESSWQFTQTDASAPPTGEFVAQGMEKWERAYLPLANEAGMLSWSSVKLQGSPARSFHEFFGFPLIMEDFTHVMVHRGFWLAREGREPFSLSAISPEGMKAHVGGAPEATMEGGPGWFRVSRDDAGGEFRATATLWCPAESDELLEYMYVEVTNTGKKPLTLHPYAAIPIFARSADRLRDHRHLTTMLHRYRTHDHGVTVVPCMYFDERGHKVNRARYTALAFGPGGAAPVGLWTKQRDFLGEGGTYAAPQAVWKLESPQKSDALPEAGEAVGAFRFAPLTLAPGKSAGYLLVSGISDDPAREKAWQKTCAKPLFAQTSLEATRKYWQERLGAIVFRTGEAHFNNWLTWVNLQPVLRRIYGNSYTPELDYGRGGKGWRDLWQDCISLLLLDPARVRPILMHNFAGIRIDGSNATVIGEKGNFIADRNNIPRTWMDHGVWPTLTTLLYVDQTGDADILLQERPYYSDHLLFRCKKVIPDWTAARGTELVGRNGQVYRGSVIEHMLVQTLTTFFNVGEHNLCRLEDADWNDGMDMAHNRGEAVAFSAFYAWNLRRIAQAAQGLAGRGHKTLEIAAEMAALLDRLPGRKKVNYNSPSAKRDVLAKYLQTVAKGISGRRAKIKIDALAADLTAKADDLYRRIRTQEWITPAKGLSYFNGYYDNTGSQVEGKHKGQLRMTLTGQVFPIMAGVASEQQVDDAIRAVDRVLRDPRHDGPRLITDFGDINMDLGRAFGFVYGEKENGAVFSHMAVMWSYALYARRRTLEGRKVWETLYRKSSDQDTARIMPGIPEYFNANGRGEYCYLTGSAPWLVFLLVTQAYGLRGEMGDFVIDPQLTLDDFHGATATAVQVRFADRPLMVTFANPHNLLAGKYQVQSVTANGAELPFERLATGGVKVARREILNLPAGKVAQVKVTLAR